MKLRLWTLLIGLFFSLTALAHPCDPINPNFKSDIISKVEFQGPSNAFWTYVSTDPTTWQFLIERPKVTKGTLEVQMKATRSDVPYAEDFTSDLHFIAGNIAQFDGKVQKAVLPKMSNELKRFRKENLNAIPRGQWFLFQFATPTGEPLYTCKVGYGTNQLHIALFGKDGVTRLRHREIELNLAEPVITKNKVKVRSDDGGAIDIKGLPIGMINVGAASDNPIMAYFTRFDQTCTLILEERGNSFREKSNDCAKAQPQNF